MVAVLELSTRLDASPQQVRDAVLTPRLMLHVCAPLLRFRPIRPAVWPDRFEVGPYTAKTCLLGVVPLGQQVIEVSFPDAPDGAFLLRDNGHSSIIARWDHLITIAPGADGGSRYSDRVSIEAGWRTAPVAAFARILFAHRQRRLRRLAAAGFDYNAV